MRYRSRNVRIYKKKKYSLNWYVYSLWIDKISVQSLRFYRHKRTEKHKKKESERTKGDEFNWSSGRKLQPTSRDTLYARM